MTEERNEQMTDTNMEPTPHLSDFNDDNTPQEGFTFKWFNLFIGVAICLWMTQGGNLFSDNWSFYIYLCIVVIIHELGHVIMGKSFGCLIKEMQVFFLPFISYKPKQDSIGSSWRNITWSLGVLPLGGVTVFKSRESVVENAAPSPYIEDKPAWQRLLISAAGVLFNIATFLILYFALPYLSGEYQDVLWPLTTLSLFIAVLNILPVYPLDGGAIVFALYEMITGKKPSQGFTNACAWIGFIFIVLFFWVFPEWLDGILNRVFNVFF